MFKFLLIVGITAYILYKVGSFLFKIGAAAQQIRNNQSAGSMNGNPNARKAKQKKDAQGEYIDYEEVK